MSNHVSIDQAGIIRPVLEGGQDKSTIGQLIEQTNALVKEYRIDRPKRQLLFLVNMDKLGKHKMSARQAGVSSLKDLPYDKIGIICNNRIIKYTTALVITASGQTAKVKQFTDEASALKWLKS